jgi:Phosphodiester glycosidase
MRQERHLFFPLLVSAIILLQMGAGAAAAPPDQPWTQLEPGLDLGLFPSPRPSPSGDSVIRVLRIDPERFELRLFNASATEEKRPLTAKQWCERFRCIAAINASMFQTDLSTSISLMRTGEHVNNPRLSRDRAVLAFNRLSRDVPPVLMIDRDCDNLDALSVKYGTLVQSIRMLSCKGKNVWAQQPQRWSTAAVGTDRKGRVLFIHVRSPFATHDLVNILMELPLELARAMYVEGGEEAQLFIAAGGRNEEFVGAYDIPFYNSGAANPPPPVPNVIAVMRKQGR